MESSLQIAKIESQQITRNGTTYQARYRALKYRVYAGVSLRQPPRRDGHILDSH